MMAQRSRGAALLLAALLAAGAPAAVRGALTQCAAKPPVCGPPHAGFAGAPAPATRPPPELSPEQQAAVFAALRAELARPPRYSAAAAADAPAAPVAEGGAPGRVKQVMGSILGVLSAQLGTVRPTNNITVPNDNGQGQGELIQMLTYLENPHLKVGVDVLRGGVVGSISGAGMPPAFRGRSLINSYDSGRMLQQSYYGCMDGSCWNKQPWRWNPEAHISNESISTTAMPRNWGSQELLEDVLLSSSYRLLPDALAIDFTLRYLGAFDHPVNTQEVPAFFADRRLSVLALYTGDKPWSGDNITLLMPGGVNEDYTPTERWAAYIEPESGYGIGVFTPIATGLTSYRVGRDGSTRASDTSYLAMTATYDIPRNASRAYRTYVAVGRVDEIRETFRKYVVAEGLAPAAAGDAPGPAAALSLPASHSSSSSSGSSGIPAVAPAKLLRRLLMEEEGAAGGPAAAAVRAASRRLLHSLHVAQ